MSKLYEDLAPVYEAMYHTFIDYEEEYAFYSKILKHYQKKQVLEIGSGTGNLAGHFLKNGFEYLGLDFSKEMIDLAKGKILDGKFIHGDMRKFKVDNPVESIISTGRTLSYLLKNEDIKAAFSSFSDNLQKDGIVCFDFIDANQFIPLIAKGKKVEHTATYRNTIYVRKSLWSLNLEHGMDFNWHSVFYTKEDNREVEIGEDHSIIRAFTVNELEVFLSIQGFKVIELIERASYAFPTYVIVAEKME